MTFFVSCLPRVPLALNQDLILKKFPKFWFLVFGKFYWPQTVTWPGATRGPFLVEFYLAVWEEIGVGQTDGRTDRQTDDTLMYFEFPASGWDFLHM